VAPDGFEAEEDELVLLAGGGEGGIGPRLPVEFGLWLRLG
jgi:hypothetical protein